MSKESNGYTAVAQNGVSNGELLKSSEGAGGKADSGCHRAGYDAFMTGFSLATFLVHHTKLPLHPESWQPQHINTDKIVNRIYLACKDFPMLVQKSTFAKSSGQHYLKMTSLGLYKE